MPVFENNGAILHYVEKGAGKLLLILPGNTASSVCHAGEIEFFGNYFRVVSMDFRGTGKSSRLSQWMPSWWEECVQDLAALVKHLEEKEAILMGTSGGANIALLFAIRYPKVASAVIADSCAETYSPDNLRREVENRSAEIPELVEFWSNAHGADWQRVVKADSQLLLRFAEMGGNIYNGALVEVKCPVLLTGSVKDSFIPDIAKQHSLIARQIANCSKYLDEQGEHPFMWICPQIFRERAMSFLATQYPSHTEL